MARRRQDPTAALIAPERPALARASALAVATNLLWFVQAWAVAAGIAAIVAPTTAPTLAPTQAAAAFLAAGMLRAGLTAWAEGLLFRAADRVIETIRKRILTRETREGPGATGPGATAALAAEKLDLLAPFVTRYTPARARTLVVPLAILAAAFWWSWAVGLIFLVTGPLIPLFMALIGMAAQAASEKQMAEIGSLSDLLVDRLGALVDMRLLGAAPAMIAGFEAQAESLRARTMAVLRIAFLSSTVLELFAAIGVAMVAVYLGFSLLGALHFGTWGRPLGPFEVVFLLMLAPEFYQPLRDLAAAWHDRAAAAAVAEDIAGWEAAARSPGLGTGADLPPLAGALSLVTSGLVLARGDRRIAIPDITLAPGEMLGLTGESGAGKTSLLMALAGLIRPAAGAITVAGRPLDEATADAWRARLGWMPQAPHFLDRSLRENIAFAPGADVSAALATARVDHVVAALPEGQDTRLGETGAGLSGGEARRVSLARAIHAGADLVLADEPTADLDARTAEAVTDALLALAAEGNAVVVATHDPDLAARCTRTVDLGGAG